MASDWPAGFSQLQAAPETAFAVDKMEIFPGFAVFPVLQRWTERADSSPSVSAMLVLATCAGQVSLIDMEVSKEGDAAALFKLRQSMPANPIRPLSIKGLATERAVLTASRTSCTLRRVSTKSTVEIPVAATDDTIVSVLARSILITKVFREAWLITRKTRQEETKFGDGSSIKLPDGTSLTHTQIDLRQETNRSEVSIGCSPKTLATLRTIAYSSSGEVLSDVSKGALGPKPTPVAPGTIGETLVNYICAL